MLRRIIIVSLSLLILLPSLFADQADQVFAALTAKNDKEVTRLLQNLALTRDFDQLDKVQAKNPKVFSATYFPGDFVSKIIFNYVENAAAAAKAAQAAKGTTNPNDKGSWQWYIWDLDKAQSLCATTKDADVLKSLQARMETDVAALNTFLSNPYLDIQAQMGIGLYLYANNMNSILGAFGMGAGDHEASLAERMNTQFGGEAATILEYLFKAGVPFPAQLPGSLKLEAWKREKAAFEAFTTITAPDKQCEYGTKDEFAARNAEWKELGDLVMSTELVVPAKLALGTFSVEGGYFPLLIALPALDAQDQNGNSKGQLVAVYGLDKADIRYYLDRKNAPFFKDKGFTAWTASAAIAASAPGRYSLKELVVKNGKDLVTDGLWGFRVRNTRGSSGETVMSIENYVKGREYDFSGVKVTGFGATIPIRVDGSYVLSGAAGTPSRDVEGGLTALWVAAVGSEGLAGGIVFYDKGSYSDGWRYLEAAPSDQSTGIQWSNGEYIDIKTNTAVGTGKANTDAIIAAQGDGNYAAALCKNLTINGFSDWFLPSKDELDLMYTNLKKAGLGGSARAGSGRLPSATTTPGYRDSPSAAGTTTTRTTICRPCL